nr:MAG TPA: hypothetical protein [Podoviridae sp. ctY3D12]
MWAQDHIPLFPIDILILIIYLTTNSLFADFMR